MAARGRRDTAEAVPLDALRDGTALADARLVVNTTPLGLAGDRSRSRFEAAPRHCLFVDLVYGATPVAVPGRRRERRAVRRSTAPRMLLHQGALAFEWPGRAGVRHSPPWCWRSVVRDSRCLASADAVRSASPPARTMSSRLGEILRRRGVLTAEQLALATGQRSRRGRSPASCRVSASSPRMSLVRALARRIPPAESSSRCAAQVPRAALDVVPHALARTAPDRSRRARRLDADHRHGRPVRPSPSPR